MIPLLLAATMRGLEFLERGGADGMARTIELLEEKLSRMQVGLFVMTGFLLVSAAISLWHIRRVHFLEAELQRIRRPVRLHRAGLPRQPRRRR